MTESDLHQINLVLMQVSEELKQEDGEHAFFVSTKYLEEHLEEQTGE